MELKLTPKECEAIYGISHLENEPGEPMCPTLFGMWDRCELGTLRKSLTLPRDEWIAVVGTLIFEYDAIGSRLLAKAKAIVADPLEFDRLCHVESGDLAMID